MLVGGVAACWALLGVFCWVFIASADDAEKRNAYFDSFDSEYVRACFAENGVQYNGEQGWNTGVYSTISLFVDKECRLPESVISYMEQHQLGFLMFVELYQGPPGSGRKLETKCFF